MLPLTFSRFLIFCIKISWVCLLKIYFPGLLFRLIESECLTVGSSQTQHMFLQCLQCFLPQLSDFTKKNYLCVTGVSLNVPVSKNVSFHPRLKMRLSCPVFPLGSLVFSILHALKEKAMAPHSSTLAWKIPWMEEPGGLQSMGSLRVGHD